MPVTLYGIKNCNTMKKAWTWLDENGIDYTFHDYKKTGIDRGHLNVWSDKAGWEKVINRTGMTFRKLPDERKQGLTRESAIALMLEQPSMIKRPVLDKDGEILIGFAPADYTAFFNAD